MRPRERRRDGRVAQLHARVIDDALIAFELRLLLLHEGTLRIDLLLRDRQGADRRVAHEVAFAVGEQRFIERLLGQRLIEGRLERARIYLQKKIALPDRLSFLEIDLVDLSINARAYGRRCSRPARRRARFR